MKQLCLIANKSQKINIGSTIPAEAFPPKISAMIGTAKVDTPLIPVLENPKRAPQKNVSTH
jgi:hypothetical protein